MKTISIKKIAGVLCALCCAGTMMAQDVWQWDFSQGNFDATLGSNSLQYVDGPGQATAAGTVFASTATLGIPPINGTNANVMEFPVSGPGMGYLMPVPPDANGGGSLLNNYTIIMDVLFPTNTVNHVRPLLWTDNTGDGISPNANLVVDSSGGIGVPSGPYNGSIQPNVWYRIAFAVSEAEVDEYINGVKVGVQVNNGGLDGALALTPGYYAELFGNSSINNAAAGYVSSIQLQDVTLNAGQIEALGAAAASKIPTNALAVPSFLETQNPAPNDNNASPEPLLTATLNAGGTVIDSNSINFSLDGTLLPTTVVYTGSNYLVSASAPSLLLPLTAHTATLTYTDSVAGSNNDTWSFSVASYQNVNLPAPIYLETFDEVPVGGIPAGWTVTNWTDVLTPGLNIQNPNSDSYLNWVTIDVADYTNFYTGSAVDYASPGFPVESGNLRMMIPPIVENGVLLTSLASNNLMVAESDQRDGSQVQVMFTTNYNFTGISNVYVSFHNMYEQNQDNIGSVEYSIDNGATWQPVLYLLDDGTTDTGSDSSDVITNPVTGQIDVVATFETARDDQAHGLAYGTFIGAAISTNLIPYIRPCRQDDPIQQKRIEVFRLPLADNQPNVSMRFMQAGTGSWFFDIDDLGFYSIPEPIILQQPGAVSADYNGPATFSVQAGGDNLTYQWLFNGNAIPDATNANYVIPETTTNNIGSYSVGVTNSYGGVVSVLVPLTLVYTPVVLSPPLGQTISPGQPVQFSITARGGQPLSYQWLFNSNVISGATGTTYSIAAVSTNDSGAYQVLVSNAFSSVYSLPANLSVFAGSITSSMVVHLTFDNTYADSSGRGNDSAPVGTPDFEPGFLGQAIHIISSGTPENNPATNNYVTLNYPGDLQFGSDLNSGGASDFSISFWTKIFHQNDDKPFISNKDWSSGGNPGWGLFTEGSGMKWNYRDDAYNEPGVGSARRDSATVGPQLEDGGWHHVLVTMARHTQGSIYVDGVLLDQSPLGTDSPTNIVGSADTTGLGFSVNIGQDGTGTYTDGTGGAAVDMLVDDLAIWRRVVTPTEDQGIFNAGLHSNTVDQATVSTPGAGPLITLQPQDTGAGLGATATFAVSAIGTTTVTNTSLNYQWYFGSSLLSGQTNASLAITNVSSTSQGGYSVIITNGYGAVTSSVANLIYTGLLPASITLEPVSQFVTSNSPAIFTVMANGQGTLIYQWYKGSTALSGATNFNLIITNAQLADQGSYYVSIANGSTSPTNSTPALLDVFTGTLNSGLVAYIPFDGDYRDYSGNNNNGTAVGSPTFGTGRVGQALHFTTTNNVPVQNYVTLGYPADLRFNTNNYSVGFWVNYTNQNDDPAFIANKNWNSSGGIGWGIFSQGGGNFRVNSTDGSGNEVDTSATPLIRDGNWHFILSTFWRGQNASVYLDGQLLLTTPMTFSGSVDTVTNGYAVNIGQDGTGDYTDNTNSSLHIDGLIDEVMLWNRVVTPSEVISLYKAGTNNLTPLMFVTSLTRTNNTVTLSWKGGIPPFSIQSKTNLTDASWTAAGSTTNQSTSVNVGASTGFYRIQGAGQ